MGCFGSYSAETWLNFVPNMFLVHLPEVIVDNGTLNNVAFSEQVHDDLVLIIKFILQFIQFRNTFVIEFTLSVAF